MNVAGSYHLMKKTPSPSRNRPSTATIIGIVFIVAVGLVASYFLALKERGGERATVASWHVLDYTETVGPMCEKLVKVHWKSYTKEV